jgi:hypothetical protein
MFQYGYGAYELTSTPGFSHKQFTLLDRGFVYAFAHIRGGGELGRLWYEEGKLLKKKNTFYDFIAVAEHLINEVSLLLLLLLLLLLPPSYSMKHAEVHITKWSCNSRSECWRIVDGCCCHNAT